MAAILLGYKTQIINEKIIVTISFSIPKDNVSDWEQIYYNYIILYFFFIFKIYDISYIVYN